jgi:hypothetical protein
MRDIFKDIIELEDIAGILLISREGRVLFKEVLAVDSRKFDEISWVRPLWKILDMADELELLFENGRLYVRKAAGGVLLFFLGNFAPFAMVRMKCDILIPKLENSFNGKKKSRFFRRS